MRQDGYLQFREVAQEHTATSLTSDSAMQSYKLHAGFLLAFNIFGSSERCLARQPDCVSQASGLRTAKLTEARAVDATFEGGSSLQESPLFRCSSCDATYRSEESASLLHLGLQAID